MFISNLISGSPGLSALGVAILISACATAMVAARRRRVRKLRRTKTRARELLMEARRSASLKTASVPYRVPLLVRMIRTSADKAGFHLHDIGTSDRQLERLLLTAKEKAVGRPPERYPRAVFRKDPAGRFPAGIGAVELIELTPGDGGDMVLAATRREEFEIGAVREYRPGPGLEFGTDPPVPDDEIIVEVDDSGWLDRDRGAGHRREAAENGDRARRSGEDLPPRSGPDETAFDDTGIDRLFDQLMLDEGAGPDGNAAPIRIIGRNGRQ